MVSTYSRSPGGHSKYLPSFTVYVLPVAISQRLSGNSATIYCGGSTAKDEGDENFIINHVCMDLNKTSTTTINCCSRFHKTLFVTKPIQPEKLGFWHLALFSSRPPPELEMNMEIARNEDLLSMCESSAKTKTKIALNFASHSLLRTQCNQKIWGLELLCSPLERLLT